MCVYIRDSGRLSLLLLLSDTCANLYFLPQHTHTLGCVTIGWGSERMLMSTQSSCCYFSAPFGQREESIKTGAAPPERQNFRAKQLLLQPVGLHQSKQGKENQHSCSSLLPRYEPLSMCLSGRWCERWKLSSCR